MAACRVQHPLATVNDGVDQTLTSTVSLPPAPGWSRLSAGATAGAANAHPLISDAAEADTVIAATSGPSGADGDYTATPMLSSGTWTTQQELYVSVPGHGPAVARSSGPVRGLTYDSQSIDGETPGELPGGWIGDGWDYSPGFIERSYQPCSQDGISASGDQCWAGTTRCCR